MKGEFMKEKLDRFKRKIKQHLPEIMVVGAATFGAVGWVLAGVYRKKLEEYETVDPDAWPTIEVSPSTIESLRKGYTLKYREARHGDRFYSQSTTMNDFGERANAEFEQFKSTGEFDRESFDGPKESGEFDLYRK
jgi:hypothetical protein